MGDWWIGRGRAVAPRPLVRFQIARNWTGVDDNQDLAEYAAWVDSRLDNLADVLEWCNARGMKVCVDLHTETGRES